jgi:hypothetical protein
VWTTSNEQNNLGFEILRSNDGINYTTLGFVNSLSIGGNSSSLLNYSYSDNNLAGGNQYYRLRQLDIDGHGKLSVIVLIKGDLSLTVAFDKLFPNPASTVINVLIVVPNHDKINLIVTDIIGTRVMNKLVNVESGNNTIPVDISRLANGTYMVKLVCSSECLEAVGKFVKQ